MGEEAKQEEGKAAEAKPEEKKEEKEDDKKEEKAEEKKEEAKPSPPPPIVLFVDLHCVGCAKKIERSILKCREVEEVEIDMVQNQVRVKGIVDPQVLCSRIQKKTMRSAKVLSPLPGASQASGLTTVELQVNMHCEACAQQLRRKLLKMRGVQAAETELSTGKVTVTGTVSSDRLADYVYQRTGKIATVIPPPPPPSPKEEEKKEEAEKKPEEKPTEEKAEGKKEEDKAPQQDGDGEKKEGGSNEEKGGGEEAKKEGEGQTVVNNFIISPEEMAKRTVYWNGGGIMSEEEMAKRMVPWMPVYFIERPPPPPQLFSDENPNACCIS